MNSVNKSLTELSVEHATAINQASSLIAQAGLWIDLLR